MRNLFTSTFSHALPGERPEGFVVGRYRMPSFELLEHNMTMHRLAIHARPIKIEAQTGGAERAISQRRSHLHFSRCAVWCQVGGGADSVHYLARTSIRMRAATALSNKDLLETMPHFRFRDRLLAEIALALAQNLSPRTARSCVRRGAGEYASRTLAQEILSVRTTCH